MRLLRLFLFPVSLVYALVVYIRNFLFDVGVFSSKTFETPTICVGNLSVGGTGKTPMIELLVQLLSPAYSIAVLSRGYGRKSKGFQISSDHTKVEILGDEPYQIAQKFPEISVAVDADRRKGISILEDTIKPDLILLDDAYQHRKVTSTFSLLLTAYDHLFVDDWYLPTGNLRDSKKEAKRADIIIVTKCPKSILEVEQQRIIEKIKPLSHQKVLFSFLKYDLHISNGEEALVLSTLKNSNITLITGIAQPAPLLSFLKEHEIHCEHLKFKDHHFFSEQEIRLFNTKEFILTTEKDFVRLKGKVSNLYYIPITHEFIGNGKEVLKDALTKKLFF